MYRAAAAEGDDASSVGARSVGGGAGGGESTSASSAQGSRGARGGVDRSAVASDDDDHEGESDEDGESEDGEVHPVEFLVAQRRRGGRVQYRIRWLGLGEDDDSWQDESTVDPVSVREFYEAASAKRHCGGRGGGGDGGTKR